MSYIITALLSLLALFILFTLLMGLKYAILRNGWQNNRVMQILALVFSRVFDALDILANYISYSVIALHWPNQWHEGRTISEHADAIIFNHLMLEDNRPLTRHEEWTLYVAVVTCTHLNKIDSGHCRSLK